MFISSGPSRTVSCAPRGGFTLIELLVTIGIIVLLIGIALPALVSVRKSAKRSAMTNQLQMIYTGLEAFKSENNDRYPEVDLSTTPPYGVGDNGAFALCRALFAPAPASAKDPATELADNKDDLGFRKEPGNGRVYGPYLRPEGFRFGYAVSDGAGGFVLSEPGTVFTGHDYAKLMIADGNGKPILYCAPLSTRPRFGQGNVFFADSRSTHPNTDIVYYDLDRLTGHPGVTNAEMNAYRGLIRHRGETDDSAFLARTRTMLGARNDPGNIGKLVGTQPSFTFPVLLWSAGPDGVFGAAGGSNLDDVVLSEQVQ